MGLVLIPGKGQASLAKQVDFIVPVCSRQTGVEQQVLIRQGAINAKTAEMAVLTLNMMTASRQDYSALPAPRPSGRLRKRRRSKTLPAFLSNNRFSSDRVL